jgi:hypothetical protein
MIEPTDSAASLVRLIERRAPEYLDLLTAETDEEFEAAFEVILGKAVSQLERQRKNFAGLSEVGLSGVLAMAMSIPGLTVTPEPHSNGHVDLMIVADHSVPERIKLGEAKIYRGPEYHVKGLEQLLGRYTTGREGRGLLIVYFRAANIADLVHKLRAKLDADLPCKQQGKTADHILKWSFRSTHTLKSGDNHEVGHIGCNLCSD